MTELVADRYLVLDGRWLDLVTGRSVGGQRKPGPMTDDGVRACAEAAAVWRDGTSRLIDCGPASSHSWFEVWNAPCVPGPPVYAVRHLSRPIVSAVVRVAESHGAKGPRVLTIRTCSGAGTVAVLSDIAVGLRTLGYVTLRVDHRLPREIRRRLRHRHLALIDTADSRNDGSTAAWIADLAGTSHRAHLVLSVTTSGLSDAGPTLAIEACDPNALVEAFVPGRWRPPVDLVRAAARHSEGWPGRFAQVLEAARPTPNAVHERAPVYGLARGPEARRDDDVPLPSSLVRFSRAQTFARRGRHAAATRWYRSALEAARRRRDAPASTAAFGALADRLRREGRLDQIARVASSLLARPASSTMRLELASLAARAFVAAGALAHAETWVALAETTAQLARQDLPDAALAARAELRLWQGRFDQGQRELHGAPETASMWVWRGWLAWGARDRPAFAHAAASLAGERFATEEPRTRMWGRALRVLAARDLAECDRAGDVAVETALDEFEALARETGDPECRVFARVITREAACDHVRVRVAVHRGAAALSAGTSVIGALACRLESRAAEGKAMSLSYAASATQSLEGLEGFRRWEQRRIPTMVIDNVSALLDIVHDSDDEQGALERACAWTRTSTRATAVGVFDAADRRCLAGDAAAASPTDASDESFLGDVWARGEPGVHRAQGFETAAGPVRYGGITIAFVIARGVADTMTMLAEGVRAVASISAPLVRARLDALGVCARADELATGILGASPAMAAVRAEVARAATAPFSVLIEGESGTGKELVARALHRLGPRRDRRFCACNCAAFTDELFESELFGHARGAFTGAVAARAGLFEEAHRGTLFLDEVAELSPRAQAKLLRVLQEGEIRRVGENAPRAIDVRIVAATNRTLAAQVASGNFREDLLFRLAVVRISLPPLRERVEDIAVLAQTLWRESARRAGSHALMGPDAIAALCRNTWPGNVRQLQNALAALAVVAPARGRVSARHVHHVLAGLGGGVVEPDVSLDVARRTAERRAVAAALARHAGRRRAAARELGLSRQGLTKAIRRLGLMAS